MPATLLSAAGRPMLSQAGRPLLPAPAGVRLAAAEPAAPAGWGEVFYDDFPGTSLDRTKWGVLYGGSTTPNGALQWDHAGIVVNNGLTVRAWKVGDTWRGGGIMQGGTAFGFAGYGDCQVTIKARFPKGQGVGAYAALWPADNSWPPEFDIIETPGREKSQVMVTWHWPGPNNADYQHSVFYPLDLTEDHIYTVRRTGANWNYWIDGVEQAVPAEWAQNPDLRRMVLGLAAFVAAAGENWYGGPPDAATPATYDARVSYVRILAPSSTGGGPGPGPAPGTALARAQAFVSDLTVGANVERERALELGWITDDVLREYRSNGLTHLRYFINAGGGYPLRDQGYCAKWYDAVKRTYTAGGMKAFLSLLDIVDEGQLWNSGIPDYVNACCDSVLSYGLDPAKVCIGLANEYAGGTNKGFEQRREELLDIMHARLPNFVLLTAGADWNDPWTLRNGTMKVYPDKPRIHEWHKYHDDAGSVAVCEDLQYYMDEFARTNGTVVFNGEWGIGPPDNKTGAATNYPAFPTHLRAAYRGMGPQRVTMWAICGDPNTWWRINEFGSARLRTEMANEFKAGDAHIRAQSWFTGAVAPPPAAAPSITIDPSSPGTLTETVAGQGAKKKHVITTTGMGAFDYVVVRADWSWRDPRPTVQTTGRAEIEVTYYEDGDFLKVLKSDDYSVSRDGGQVDIVHAATPQPPVVTPPGDPTAVDDEYPAYSGTARPTGKSGPLQTGQSNCGFFLSEAIWYETEGLAAMLGVPKGFYNPQINGVPQLDAYGLGQGAKTNPDAYTTVGGTPLFDHGSDYPFLNATAGGAASGWAYGHSGQALHQFITALMTADERASCMGVQVLHNERDTEINTDYQEMLDARLNFMAKVRASFGRPATGENGLPFFFVYPIPYGGNAGGHAMIRRAWRDIIANPANNAHLVVGQTADSDGGLRYGATSRDYSHRATEDLQNIARRAAFGVARVLNSQRGVGNRAMPSFGPRVRHCYAESATSTIVTVAHDRGDALRFGGGSQDGRGWTVEDNGGKTVHGLEMLNGSQIRINHDAAGSGREITYCYWGQQLGQGGGIYDNNSLKPRPAGWPSGLDSSWHFDWPLRGFLGPMPVSGTAFVDPGPRSTGQRLVRMDLDNGASMSAIHEDDGSQAWQHINSSPNGPTWDLERPVWGSGSEFQHLYMSGSRAAALDVGIVAKAGPNGTANALRMSILAKPNGATQVPLLANPLVPPTEFYVKYHCWLPANLASVISGGAGFVVMGPEWKTTNDQRIIAFISPVGGTPRFGLKIDRDTNGNLANETYYNQNNEGMAVPLDRWFLWEYYCKRGGPGVGRVWTKCDGAVVHDVTMNNIGVNNEPIQRLFLLNCYANSPITYYISDFELWDYAPGASPTRLWLDSIANGALGSYRSMSTRPIGGSAGHGVGVPNSGTEFQLQQYVSGRSAHAWTLAGAVSIQVTGSDPNNAGIAYRAKLYRRTAAGTEVFIGNIDAPTAISSSYTQRTWSGSPPSTAMAVDDRLVLKLCVRAQNGGTIPGGYSDHAHGGRRIGGTIVSWMQIAENVSFKPE